MYWIIKLFSFLVIIFTTFCHYNANQNGVYVASSFQKTITIPNFAITIIIVYRAIFIAIISLFWNPSYPGTLRQRRAAAVYPIQGRSAQWEDFSKKRPKLFLIILWIIKASRAILGCVMLQKAFFYYLVIFL